MNSMLLGNLLMFIQSICLKTFYWGIKSELFPIKKQLLFRDVPNHPVINLASAMHSVSFCNGLVFLLNHIFKLTSLLAKWKKIAFAF